MNFSFAELPEEPETTDANRDRSIICGDCLEVMPTLEANSIDSIVTDPPRLITPPEGLVLDPFAGSGSTGKACKLEGFRFIGIEKDEEYCKIARARIE